MGAQIAMVCALAGHDTTVTDLADDALARAESSLRSRLDRDAAKGRRTRDDVDAAFALLTFTTDLDAAASTADLVDLTGIDIGYHAKLARHAVTGDPRDLPSRTVTALVERGDLGRKTGKGFYTYDASSSDDKGGNRS